MVDPKLIESGNFAEITRLTNEAVNIVLGFGLAHVGINCKDSNETHETAKLFCQLFGLEYKPGNSAVFAGNIIETLTPIPGRGEKGHIAIGTNNIDRAIYQLTAKGVTFRDGTAAKDTKGNIKAIYLDLDINGFAVHLIQK